MQSHILSRTDYCKVLFVNAIKGDIKNLQKVLNTAVKFIYNLDICTTIATTLAKECHFLPVNITLYELEKLF